MIQIVALAITGYCLYRWVYGEDENSGIWSIYSAIAVWYTLGVLL